MVEKTLGGASGKMKRLIAFYAVALATIALMAWAPEQYVLVCTGIVAMFSLHPTMGFGCGGDDEEPE